MAEPRIVRIGGAAGMWGDSSLSTPQLLEVPELNYIIYESLAEITMAILTRAKMKSADLGYAVDVIKPGITKHLTEFKQKGIRVVTNAGGVNPQAAANVLREAAAKAGIALRVATVSGDDLSSSLEALREAGVCEMTSGAEVSQGLVSVNAYLGALPIAAALDAGADIVVTGRVADSALVLGPLIHEFDWRADDYDRLAAGSLAGHLLECGPQSTGGLLTDWQTYESWSNMGYPIAECREDGGFVVAKPQGTDGVVNIASVTEQILYEIADPRAYILPDVVCDFADVQLSEIAEDRVEVRNAKGRPPTPYLKACGLSMDGFRTQFLCMIGGRDAALKAERLARDLLRRVEEMFKDQNMAPFRETSVEALGAESTYGPHSRARDAREVVLKIAVAHESADALNLFAREAPSVGLGAAQGVTGGGAGRAKPTPLARLHSYLVPRALVSPRVEIDGKTASLKPRGQAAFELLSETTRREPSFAAVNLIDGVEIPLLTIAYGRSGDKGNICNIGIAARHEDFLPLIAAQASQTRVAEYLAHMGASHVERLFLPGLKAFNFVLHDALGGGGAASLRFDPQGKAAAQMLLDMPVLLPCAMLRHAALKRVRELEEALRET